MRSIDCYLTDEEQTAILDYLFKGIKADNLTKVEAIKRVEYNRQISNIVPNTALTYRTFIQKNNILCPIDEFLTNFSNTLENEKIRLTNHNLLKKLETEIIECGAPCPCPAECNYSL